MARGPRTTRAQRRERRAGTPTSGVYGIDAEDAGADSWRGRYLFFAASSGEARARIREAGFHRRQIAAEWSPAREPPEGWPADLGPGDDRWFRSRLDDAGWTAWEPLPAGYRHPPRGLAATDPSAR